MTFWFAVSHEIPNKKELERTKKTFWCLPSSAAIGDFVFLYCPRAASPKYQGVYALCEIKARPKEDHPKNYFCTPYLHKKEPLLYTELKVVKIYEHHIKPKHIKSLSVFSQSGLVKKNFQSTIFVITKEQSDELIKNLESIQ